MAKKTMGQLADEHFRLGKKIKQLRQQTKDLEHEQARIEAEAIELSEEQGNKLCRGNLADGEVRIEDRLNIKNPKELNTWVAKTGHFEIYQARVSSTGYRDLVAAGMKPPGIGIFKQPVFTTKAAKAKKRS